MNINIHMNIIGHIEFILDNFKLLLVKSL
ncbi:uncharacterized protein METZ01_LOCUS286972 [marine metagenome]|uniref:Uncharacterized protein n=1 Tax=marine metagenome TaxID=408172 RepID=A0A382LBA9_9ZZZZ